MCCRSDGCGTAQPDAIGYAKFYSRSHDAVIRVNDEADNVIETHEHTGDFRRAVRRQAKAYLATILIGVVLVLVGVGFISEGPKHIPAFAAYAAGAVLILLTILASIWLVRRR